MINLIIIVFIKETFFIYFILFYFLHILEKLQTHQNNKIAQSQL